MKVDGKEFFEGVSKEMAAYWRTIKNANIVCRPVRCNKCDKACFILDKFFDESKHILCSGCYQEAWHKKHGMQNIPHDGKELADLRKDFIGWKLD